MAAEVMHNNPDKMDLDSFLARQDQQSLKATAE
jgi:hypothetical protein